MLCELSTSLELACYRSEYEIRDKYGKPTKGKSCECVHKGIWSSAKAKIVNHKLNETNGQEQDDGHLKVQVINTINAVAEGNQNLKERRCDREDDGIYKDDGKNSVWADVSRKHLPVREKCVNAGAD